MQKKKSLIIPDCIIKVFSFADKLKKLKASGLPVKGEKEK